MQAYIAEPGRGPHSVDSPAPLRDEIVDCFGGQFDDIDESDTGIGHGKLLADRNRGVEGRKVGRVRF